VVELLTALQQAHRESPSWRLYGLCHQAATRIAELEAEVERLANERDHHHSDLREKYLAEAEALSRTGAVKVLDPDMPAQEMRLHMGEMTAQKMRTARAAIRWANTRLPALEPAAPEGQQEAAWMRRWAFDGIDVMKIDKPSRPVGWQFQAVSEVKILPDDIPLYTRPSEQAVTEAQVEVVARHITAWFNYSWEGLGKGSVVAQGFPVFHHGTTGLKFQGRQDDMRNLARDLLTAAQEASHDPA